MVKRELSGLLHGRWRAEAVSITITEVDVSPDLKNAKVFYSVFGGRESAAKAARFLSAVKKELRRLLSKNIILKYTPELNFIYDASAERAMKTLAILDELDADANAVRNGEEREREPGGPAEENAAKTEF